MIIKKKKMIQQSESAIKAIAKRKALEEKQIEKKKKKYIREWQTLETSGYTSEVQKFSDTKLKNKYDAIPDMILSALISDEVKAQQKFVDWAKEDFKGFVKDVVKFLPITKAFSATVNKTESKIVTFAEGLEKVKETIDLNPQVFKNIEEEIVDK